MNIRKIIKEKTLRLIGLVLITIPLMAFYPILLYLGLSVKIAAIATVCLIRYRVTRIEPVLRRIAFIADFEKVQKTTITSNEERLNQLANALPKEKWMQRKL